VNNRPFFIALDAQAALQIPH